MHMFAYLVAAAALLHGATAAFNMDTNTNVAVYWGQNSNGTQKDLGAYCNDTSIDTIMLSFLNTFKGQGGQPEYSFSNACSSDNGVFPGTNLPQCQFLSQQIQSCQSAGKIVTLSLGGGGNNSVGFANASDAQSFADTIWNDFLGGNGPTRPLGAAVLDGVDLDIESGSDQFYDAFVDQIRSRATGNAKQFFITGAPQCVQPDSHLNTAMLNSQLDAIYVQFYNNAPCYLPNTAGFNFAAWDDFARNKAKNPKMKVYIGAPASDQAAQSGFVNIDTFKQIVTSVQKNFTSFGGVMLYDASQAQANNNYEAAVKSTLVANAGGKREVLGDADRPRVRSRLFRLD